MKRRIINAVIILLTITGLGIVFYPAISGYLFRQETNSVIEEFDELRFVKSADSDLGSESEKSKKLYEDM